MNWKVGEKLEPKLAEIIEDVLDFVLGDGGAGEARKCGGAENCPGTDKGWSDWWRENPHLTSVR